jgi:hypothetical protein
MSLKDLRADAEKRGKSGDRDQGDDRGHEHGGLER